MTGSGRAPGATGHDTKVEIYRPFGEVIERSRAGMKGRSPGKHPRLTMTQYVDWANASGIHPDTVGPVCRAANDLGWVLMFRSLREMAKEHAGSHDTLPKPMEIKVKCDDESGLVCCTEAELEAAKKPGGKIDPHFAETQGLKVVKRSVLCKGGVSREKNVLVNSKGQGYYSDMDLFAVVDVMNGDRIMMGSGRQEHEGVAQVYRAKLDSLINVLKERGTEYNLIQHGADYDWADRGDVKMKDEDIAIFIPFAPMMIVKTVRDTELMVMEIQRQAKQYR